MVPNSFGNVSRTANDSAECPQSVVRPERATASPSGTQGPASCRLKVIRQKFRGGGLSDEVIQLLVEGDREATSNAYPSAWNCWINWCFTKNQNSLSLSGIGTILEFLTFSLKEGKAFRTINVYRCMLPSTLNQIDGFDNGKHPLGMRLIRGVLNQNQPKPRYTAIWDVDKVLNFNSSLGENSNLSYSILSQKSVLLLSLTLEYQNWPRLIVNR